MTTKQESKNTLQNITVSIMITATSSKQSKKFKQDEPTKTVYFFPETEEDKQKLLDFGMTEYTPNNETEEPFFICKMARQVSIFYKSNPNIEPLKYSGKIENPNFSTENFVKANIIKGENLGHEFFRLQALQLDSLDELVQVKETNPFI